MSCNNRGCGCGGNVGGSSTRNGCWTTSTGGCGNVGGASTGCGCGNVGGTSTGCGCGNVGGASTGCGNVGGESHGRKCCVCYLVEPITNFLKCLCGGCHHRHCG